VRQFPDGAPLAEFRVRTCFMLDQCAAPLGEDAVSDRDGSVVIDLAQNRLWLNTYFRVTAPPGTNYPVHLFFPAAWTLTHSFRQDLTVYVREGIGSIPLPDPHLGGVLFFAYDCAQALDRAAGVAVSASPAGSSKPTQYTGLGHTQTTDAPATFANGIGFIENLPPGLVVLTATRVATGELIGKTSIVIEADAITVAELVPTP